MVLQQHMKKDFLRKKIAMVDRKTGLVEGLKKGTVKTTVTSSNGLKATVKVKVTKK